MEKLPLSRTDYDSAVLVVAALEKIKQHITALPSVTDVVFKPIINGYEVCFKKRGNPVKLRLKADKGIFKRNKLIVSVFSDDNLIKTFRTYNADESVEEIKSIFRL